METIEGSQETDRFFSMEYSNITEAQTDFDRVTRAAKDLANDEYEYEALYKVAEARFKIITAKLEQ